MAFEPFLSSRSPAIPGVLAAAFDHAVLEREFIARSIVIDKRALLSGVILHGLRSPGSASTSWWLVEWLQGVKIDPKRLLEAAPAAADRNRAAFTRGVRIVASRSLIGHVLPAARELAQQTVGRDRADLRHLIFALLDEPSDSFGELGSFLAGERLPSLKAWLVERITAAPERDENVDFWRALIKQPAGAATPGESVHTHSDAPAIIDSLGRQAFAEVLGARIKDVGERLSRSDPGGDSAFILHMDGPWGSGKSSILNFLKADLEGPKAKWLVVEFNAWRNQHRKPAWLPLILDVRSAAIRRITRWAPLVWLAWLWWRVRMDWLSYLLAFALVSVAGLLVWSTNPGGAEAVGRGVLGLTKSTEEALKTLGAIVAAAASFLAMARGFTLGSHRNAEIYLEFKSEPFRRIIRLFERLISATHRPVAVFVDDLDRCDSAYVIDLLEGIQTSLRSAPIVYVVAGDRKWICSSFEKRYADFCGDVGSPGRPLGYLFLDKVFQLSTSVPQLSSQRQEQYWRQLLDRSDAASPKALRDERERLEAEAALELEGKTRKEDIQHEINKTVEGSLKRETFLAAAAKQTASAEAVRAAEHRLQPLARLLEANPRSMKRLVNAYGLSQARAYLENRDVSVEALARWTIIELRWPLLADHIVRNWPEIDLTAPPSKSDPNEIDKLLTSNSVRAVIGAPRAKGRLTKKNLGPILD